MRPSTAGILAAIVLVAAVGLGVVLWHVPPPRSQRALERPVAVAPAPAVPAPSPPAPDPVAPYPGPQDAADGLPPDLIWALEGPDELRQLRLNMVKRWWGIHGTLHCPTVDPHDCVVYD